LLHEEFMMLRILVITLFITATTSVAASAQGLAALSPSSSALLDDVASRGHEGFARRIAPPEPDSRLNGFLIGFVAGAVPGVIFGMGISRYCENEARSCPMAVPVAGVLLGFAGGGIGYAIDSAVGESRTLARPRLNPGVRLSFRF
jgi:hypothetical protein